MDRGNLRIHIGVAAGVGKTCALLAEAERRARRGTDVVIGCVNGRGRPYTESYIDRLADQLAAGVSGPRATVERIENVRGELDVAALIERGPTLVVVDDLDAVNPRAHRNRFRWEDVDDLLRAGIDVITATNIEHLESLADVVHEITGSIVASSVPDSFVRSADQVELIDMDPVALRRRLAHGNITSADDLSLDATQYFRVETLAALRELALLWVADRVDDDVRRHLREQGQGSQIETKTRVVVAMTGEPGGDVLIRRGARMCDRLHGELVGVHVHPPGHHSATDLNFDANRRILAALGGRFAEITGEDIAHALVAFVRAENATQLIIGGSDRSRVHRLIHGSVVNRVLDISAGVDVHVIAALPQPQHPSTRNRGPVTSWRLRKSPTGRRLAWLLALLAAPSALAVAQSLGGGAALPVELLFFIVLIATIAWAGGKAPAVAATIVGLGAAEFGGGDTGVRHSEVAHLLELGLFAAVAASAIALVTRLRRTETRLDRATNEAEALARLAGAAVLVGPEPLSQLVTEICHAFDLTSVAVLAPTKQGWRTLARAGSCPPRRPSEADMEVQLSHGAVLVLSGDINADDQRLLSAFITQLRSAQQQTVLEDRARNAEALRRANELRDGLLMAVSHDLRTPLATIKLSAASLVSEDVEWSREQVREFAGAIELDADRLNRLVSEVLDLSRLQSGVLGVQLAPTDIAGLIGRAVATVPHSNGQIITTVTPPTPVAIADPALLERVVANLVANALTWSPGGEPIHVHAGAAAGGTEIRVVDRGPGIVPSQRASVFQPFQRLGDGNNANVTGLGLGLALARGFVDAMGGDIVIEDTPGGGTTMVVHLDRGRSDTSDAVPRTRRFATHGAR